MIVAGHHVFGAEVQKGRDGPPLIGDDEGGIALRDIVRERVGRQQQPEHDDGGKSRNEVVASDHDDLPYFRYNVGSTMMLSSVDVIRPHRMTMAIGV